MNDPQAEADKIRNKRLAKLAGGQSSGSSPSSPRSPTAPLPIEGSASVKGSADASPLAHTTSNTDDAAPVKKINITPLIPTSNTSPAPSKPKAATALDAPEQWTDRAVSSIFRFTVQPGHTADAFGNKLMFLEEIHNEIQESGEPLLLTKERLEGAIIEAASNLPDKKPLEYLLACFKRAIRTIRLENAKGIERAEFKTDLLLEAKRLCMSYCIFAATMPDMFNVESDGRNQLANHLLRDPDSDGGICHDFLREAMFRFPDDESIQELFVGAVEQISTDLNKLTMNDNFKPAILALRACTQYPPLIDAITKSPRFLPSDVPIEDFEEQSILGPFFRLSPLHPQVALNYFMGSQVQGQNYIMNNQNAVRLTLRTHQDELFDITNRIIKSGKQSRGKMLDWFAWAVNKNHKRRATYVDYKHVSSDGFMVNITTVLDRLCEPFMNSTFDKVDRIDVNYLRRSPRVEIADETKINADQKTSDEFYAVKDNGTSNFISEVFFLTVAAHHYGSEALHSLLQRLERELKHYEKEIVKMEQQRSQMTNPMQLALFDRNLKRYKDEIEKSRCVIEAIRGILLDDLTQQRSMLLMRYVIAWLLRIVQPISNYPAKEIALPLAEEQPTVFKCLPEYLLEDIVDNFKFITSHMPQVIFGSQCDELVTVCVTFLRNSEYVKNPYLKAGFVSILFHGVHSFRGKPNGTLGDLLCGSTFCHKHLLHALMQFYIEAESTGGHNQFYDKFNIRYEIFQVIRCIWTSPIYRKNLEMESKVNVDFFVRFVNLLLNDVTYVMGEAFRAFKEIHSLQEVLDDPSNGMDENERKEKEESLESQQRMAKGNMQLTNETVSMLKLFTEVLAGPFTMPEVVQRLADMLDYNLETMVGPNQGSLKVKDLASYSFNPRSLLSDMIAVYTNLSKQESFLLAIARDGRSYKPQNFDMAINIIRKTSYKSPEEIAAFRRLAKKVAQVYEADQQEEEELGDIPDEFIDPILATLMTDPVILPTSKQILDRSTIRTLLLSDPVDPFNRAPLKIEDVIPDDELKEKVKRFKEDAKARRLKAANDAEVVVVPEEDADESRTNEAEAMDLS